MPYKRIFFDTEFTGLYQAAQLLSIALIAESGETFYAERTIEQHLKINDWVSKHVVENFTIPKSDDADKRNTRIKGTIREIQEGIDSWLTLLRTEQENITFQFWGDCPHWDWVLFCELFGGAMHIPAGIHYMCMDVATLFYFKGYAPDKPRLEFLSENKIKMEGKQHNALFDAGVAKACYKILQKK